MPLRALLNGKRIVAYEQTEESWNVLKTSKDRFQLTMPCCEERAVPKTSPLGTYFFAHYRKSENCTSSPESKEHLYLKSVIAKAAKSAGWRVDTEYIGTSNFEEEWIADVFCENNKAKVALEVQLSKQNLSEFKRRQDRYKTSGVRSAWFVSESVAKSVRNYCGKELPIFTVANYEELGSVPTASKFDVSLDDFVIKLLSRQLAWKEDSVEYLVFYIRDKCWACGREVKQPYGYGIDTYIDFVKTVPNCSTVLEEILKSVGNEALHSKGINRVSAYPRFKGNAPRFPYCAECIHCGQPQANHYLMEKLKIARSKEDEYAESFNVRTCDGRWKIVPTRPE